jgi:hypothetical protein
VRRYVLICLAVLLAGGCAGLQRAAPRECTPPAGAASSAAATLAGEYRLVFVATAGPGRGRAATGRLQVWPRRSEKRFIPLTGDSIDISVSEPFYGAAEIDLSAVGAMYHGALDVRDPDRPGVVIRLDLDHERRTNPGLRMKLGSEGNRFNVIILDGGYTDAIVQSTDARGFSGVWEAGFSYTDYHAGGFFCAFRTSPAAAP